MNEWPLSNKHDGNWLIGLMKDYISFRKLVFPLHMCIDSIIM